MSKEMIHSHVPLNHFTILSHFNHTFLLIFTMQFDDHSRVQNALEQLLSYTTSPICPCK